MKDPAAIPFHFHILSMSVLSPDVFSSKQTCSENRYYMYIINYAMAFNKFYFLKNSKFFHNMIRLAGKFPLEKQLINTQGHKYDLRWLSFTAGLKKETAAVRVSYVRCSRFSQLSIQCHSRRQ